MDLIRDGDGVVVEGWLRRSSLAVGWADSEHDGFGGHTLGWLATDLMDDGAAPRPVQLRGTWDRGSIANAAVTNLTSEQLAALDPTGDDSPSGPAEQILTSALAPRPDELEDLRRLVRTGNFHWVRVWGSTSERRLGGAVNDLRRARLALPERWQDGGHHRLFESPWGVEEYQDASATLAERHLDWGVAMIGGHIGRDGLLRVVAWTVKVGRELALWLGELTHPEMVTVVTGLRRLERN